MKSKKKRIIIAIISVIASVAIVLSGSAIWFNNYSIKTLKTNYNEDSSLDNYFKLIGYLCSARNLEVLNYVADVFDYSNDELAEYGKTVYREEFLEGMDNKTISNSLKCQAIINGLIPCISNDKIDEFKGIVLEYFPKIDADTRLGVFFACYRDGDNKEFFYDNKEMIIDLFNQLAVEETDNIEKAKWLTSISAYYYNLYAYNLQTAMSIDKQRNDILEQEQVSNDFKEKILEQHKSDISDWETIFGTPKQLVKLSKTLSELESEDEE